MPQSLESLARRRVRIAGPGDLRCGSITSAAGAKVVLGDSAVRIWNPAAGQFPGTILIVDFYHASEHLHQLPRSLFPSGDAARRARTTSVADLLDKGAIQSRVAVAGSGASERPELAGSWEAEHFACNAGKMRRPEFRNVFGTPARWRNPPELLN